MGVLQVGSGHLSLPARSTSAGGMSRGRTLYLTLCPAQHLILPAVIAAYRV